MFVCGPPCEGSRGRPIRRRKDRASVILIAGVIPARSRAMREGRGSFESGVGMVGLVVTVV